MIVILLSSLLYNACLSAVNNVAKLYKLYSVKIVQHFTLKYKCYLNWWHSELSDLGLHVKRGQLRNSKGFDKRKSAITLIKTDQGLNISGVIKNTAVNPHIYLR